jgi:hypothetical protein
MITQGSAITPNAVAYVIYCIDQLGQRHPNEQVCLAILSFYQNKGDDFEGHGNSVVSNRIVKTKADYFFKVFENFFEGGDEKDFLFGTDEQDNEHEDYFCDKFKREAEDHSEVSHFELDNEHVQKDHRYTYGCCANGPEVGV